MCIRDRSNSPLGYDFAHAAACTAFAGSTAAAAGSVAELVLADDQMLNLAGLCETVWRAVQHEGSPIKLTRGRKSKS